MLFNLKFTNLQAALGISQLNTFNKRIKKLNEIHNYYKKNLIKNKKFKLFNFNQKYGQLPLWSDIYCLDRNKLYNYFVQAVKKINPKIVVMENVKGMYPYADQVKQDFEKISYAMTYDILVSDQFGVAQ